MNLKEKILKEYNGIVSIDILRNIVRDIVSEVLADELIMNDRVTEKLQYMIESIVFRTYVDEPLENIVYSSLKKLIDVACQTYLINDGYYELEKKSLNDVLMSVIFEYMSIKYFYVIDEDDDILECSPNLNQVLDIEMAIESGRITDRGYNEIDTNLLLDSITEIITYYYKDKIEK